MDKGRKFSRAHSSLQFLSTHPSSTFWCSPNKCTILPLAPLPSAPALWKVLLWSSSPVALPIEWAIPEAKGVCPPGTSVHLPSRLCSRCPWTLEWRPQPSPPPGPCSEWVFLRVAVAPLVLRGDCLEGVGELMWTRLVGWCVHCITMRSPVWQDEVRVAREGNWLGWGLQLHPWPGPWESWKPLTPLTLSHPSSWVPWEESEPSFWHLFTALFLCACCGESAQVCAQRQGKPSRVFSTCLCSHALPCSGSLFHLPSNSFLRRWNGAGCCQIQGGKKRSSQGHGLVPVCGVLQVGLEWGAGTLSSGDIADKVDKFGLRLLQTSSTSWRSRGLLEDSWPDTRRAKCCTADCTVRAAVTWTESLQGFSSWKLTATFLILRELAT